MKISIIVANYNHAQYIGQAVRSLLKQTHKDIEIIIVDDCSTDNSREEIDKLVKLDDRIVEPIYLPENRGKWFALNTGIAQRASGGLITTQDADDASSPQRLEWQLQVLLKENSYHTLCGFHNCGTQKEMEKAESFTMPSTGPTAEDIISHADVLKNVYQGFQTPGINHYYVGNKFETHGASSLFYKQLWDHGMKFMPGNMGLRCQKAEDSDFNTKLTLLLQKTSVLKIPLYCYRRGTTTNPAFLEDL